MRRAALLCTLAMLLATGGAPAAAIAASATAAGTIAAAATTAAGTTAIHATPPVAPKASLPDIEDEVMCTTCNVPLNIADSPEADRERAFIRSAIARGLDKQQIKAAMVGQYGEDVLALPSSSGFGITAYAIPIVLVIVLAGGLALLLPSWRRRSPAGIGDPSVATLSFDDARRLEDDLVRYD